MESGHGAGRALWRWACVAAADAAAAATPGNKWEAALFGALAGHVARVLPVCSGWEDEAWAYCRAWLDLGADERVAAEEEHALAGFGARLDREARGGGGEALAVRFRGGLGGRGGVRREAALRLGDWGVGRAPPTPPPARHTSALPTCPRATPSRGKPRAPPPPRQTRW